MARQSRKAPALAKNLAAEQRHQIDTTQDSLERLLIHIKVDAPRLALLKKNADTSVGSIGSIKCFSCAMAEPVIQRGPPTTCRRERDFCRRRQTRQKGPEDDVSAQRPEIEDHRAREMAAETAFVLAGLNI
jgi:hypothetical protein